MPCRSWRCEWLFVRRRGHESLAEPNFMRRRGPAEDGPVDRLDAFRRVRGIPIATAIGLRFDSLGKASCLFRNECTVQKKQGLLRNGSAVAYGNVLVGAREIEAAQKNGHASALDVTIDCSARYGGHRGERKRRSARTEIELAGNCEERIAQRLDVQPLAVHSP